MERGRNELCWCGSGLKYKYCHLNRHKLDLVDLQEILQASKQVFGKRYCLHPEASQKLCNGDIVKAHTIQKNGGLSIIARKGHVYNCMSGGGFGKTKDKNLKPNLVGIHNASTFTGFCKHHDNEVFAPIEKYPVQFNEEHTFLLSYRALCHELFLKRADNQLVPTRRKIDRGRSIQEQFFIQKAINDHATGVDKAIEDLNNLKELYDACLLRRDYSSVHYYIIQLHKTPEILCNAIHQPEYDFQGNFLQNLADFSHHANWLHFSMLTTNNGGAAVFSWVGENLICRQFIRSLHTLSDQQLPHAIVRYMFEFFENTFFAPDWWDNLAESVQRRLMLRQFTELPPRFEFPRTDDCLKDDGIRAVNWRVVDRHVNFDL